MYLVIFSCNLLLNPSIRDVSQRNLLFAAIYVYFLQFSVVCFGFGVFLSISSICFSTSRFLAGGYSGL